MVERFQRFGKTESPKNGAAAVTVGDHRDFFIKNPVDERENRKA